MMQLAINKDIEAKLATGVKKFAKQEQDRANNE